MAFALQVLTPERVLVDGPASALVLRSSDGDMTVLEGHTSLVAEVVPCVVRVDPDEGDPIRLAVHGGFLQVDTRPGGEGPSGLATTVALVAGVAEPVAEIDVERARRARDEAEAELARLSGGQAEEGRERSAEERAALAALARAELRLEAAGAAEPAR